MNHRLISWWQEGVIYQIYPRSFQDTNGDGVGDLAGITDRLSYLCDLGIQAIWLSPFFPSPMADFGYDVSEYCGVDPTFGALTEFDDLVLAAQSAAPEPDLSIQFQHEAVASRD
jgi:glycosidase